MGIIRPRPAMRAKERRTIEDTLRHHAELMKGFEAAGLPREEASRKAYVAMQTENSAKTKGKTMETKTKLTVPTIHLNGTSKESLTRQLLDAYHAIDNAVDALKQAAPNARDYYVQGPKAYSQASDEHMDRMKRLTDVMAELMEIAEEIA